MKPITVARDTGGKGLLLTEFCTLYSEASDEDSRDLIRSGKVLIDRKPVKDVLYKIEPGSYKIDINHMVIFATIL